MAQHPSIGGYDVYYGILHNHSRVSDGTGTDNDAYNYAKNLAGLDFFSTANHVGSIDPSEWISIKEAANRVNEDGVFTAFWGFEFSSEGDITVINTEDCTTVSDPPTYTLPELCTWLDERDGVAFFNHPNRGTGKVFGGFASPPSDKIVGMELFNSTDDYSMHYYNDGFYPDDGYLNHFAEANSRGWKIGAAGSDDNHEASWGTRTDWRMAILSKHLSRPDLLAAMQARRFYSTLDKNLALSFKMDSSEMGSSIEAGTYNVQIQASDLNKESFTRVMIFRNGLEMETWDMDTSDVNLTLAVNTLDNEYYYIKVTQSDGDEAISSPVYIKGGLFNYRPSCSISVPENGTHFTIPESISVEADASDTDGTIASVEFFADGKSLGTDTLPPYSVNYMIPEKGVYNFTAKATDNHGSWDISSPRTITVGVFSKTEGSLIADGGNDVEENKDGIMFKKSTELELGYDGSIKTIGLRFKGLNIPQGADIESAYIQFTVAEASTGTCILSIKGHNADNSELFTARSNNVSSRETTSSEIIWEPSDWATVAASGEDQRTPDLSSVIQEIVNRPGFTQSSAISLMITGTGVRTAESYEGSSGSAAVLTVEYTVGREASTPAPAIDKMQVRVYPNPVSEGKLTIETDTEIGDHTSVTIIDLMGRICSHTQIEHHRTVIDVSHIKSGLYIINLSNNHRVISQKLLIR